MMVLIWSFLLFEVHHSVSASGVVSGGDESSLFLAWLSMELVLQHLSAAVMFSALALDLAFAVDLWPLVPTRRSSQKQCARMLMILLKTTLHLVRTGFHMSFD